MYLKVPVELAHFAVTKGLVSETAVYLASKFLYSGKASISMKTYKDIAQLCGVSVSTVRRSMNWLNDHNWIGKNKANGIFHIRSIDYISRIQNFKFNRAALLFKENLKSMEGFFTGAVICSIAKTIKEKGGGAVDKRRSTNQSRAPISIQTIMNSFDVSRPTARRYRDLAVKAGYIDIIPNLSQVKGINPKEVKSIRDNYTGQIKVKLFGSTATLVIKPKQLRQNRGFVYVQLPNWTIPRMLMRKR